MIAEKLETSQNSKETVRALQRALYLKAKQAPNYRFYSLYDKVYRSDVLQRAYDLVRRNSSPGLDGETHATIEAEKGRTRYLQDLQDALKAKTYRASAVKRVEIPKANGKRRQLGIPNLRDRIVQMAVKLVIEPIYEADFSPHSYGFRPRRSAQQAMDDIKTGLLSGHCHIIDADLSQYFDTIAHDKLQRTLAQRIVDSPMLRLISQWLKAPIVKQAPDGKKTTVGGGKKARQGTPQGGVISPLLANIYLNLLDRIWDRHQLAEKYKARLVRYADDIVILCRREPYPAYTLLQTILEKLELQLNEGKTQLRDARQETFEFLGYQIQMARSPSTGKTFPLIEPSEASMKTIKQKIKHLTRRDMNPVPIENIVKQLNTTVRGWSNYFHYGHGHLKMKKVKHYMEESLRSHLRYRHKIRNRGASYHRYPRHYIYEYLGLFKVPTTAVWKLAHA